MTEPAITQDLISSHGINAEPSTFGLKMALMYDEFGRALERLEPVGPRLARAARAARATPPRRRPRFY